MSLAKITLIGYLGRNPDMSYTTGGTAVTKFSLPVSHKIGDKETTTWYECIAFGKLAEIISQHAQKGQQVIAIGDLKPRSYVTKDGRPGTSLDVTVETFQLLGKKSTDSDEGGKHQSTDHTSFSGDIPF